jgi:catechol 2,3-dioxygenase-like lactoylglutathione lyase family enzyme
MSARITSSARWGLLGAKSKWTVLFAVLAVLVTVAAMSAAAQVPRKLVPVRMPPELWPPRPPIVGVAHIGLKVSDLAASREFYGHVLGFSEAFKLDKPDGSLMLVYFKVNDHQYIELFPTLKSPSQDRLSHIAFETTDAQALRDYLAARGVEVPDRLKPGLDGNLSFMVTDPDGHRVEFVQYMPGSLHTRNFGKELPATRISDHIQHVGISVKDQAAADKFYKDILGFRLGWHGGGNDQTTDWVDMVVPEGHDWLEYMLNIANLTPKRLGSMHHMSLRVSSVQAAYKTVAERGYKAGEPKIGRDGKWQLNLFDPDLTRVELMEPKPVETPCCSPMPEWQLGP